ncbi:MAG TPA: ribonuclease Y [bacterium]|nr:ribonuclease Y [bacterium]
MEIVITALLVGGLAFAAGFFVQPILSKGKIEKEREEAQQMLSTAKAQQKELVLEAKDEAMKIKEKAEADAARMRAEIVVEQKRLHQKEESIDKRYDVVEKKNAELDEKRKTAENFLKELEDRKQQIVQKLESVAHMTSEEAKDELLLRVEKDIKEDALRLIKEVETATKEEADRKAREIIATAIQRCATEHTNEVTVSSVSLPSDEMKGRIIGREGRNIRALEKATGVDFIVDDTPETIVISSFDPVRREVARVSLSQLVADGRIHPARIEEVVEKAQKEVDKVVMEAGQNAANAAKVPGLKSDVLKLLGTLKFRFSYGQNVLEHSIEASNIGALMAAEIGADTALVRKAALLHDIGKAIDHKVEGGHATIGADLLKKLGFGERVEYAVRAHHEDVPLKSPEDFIVLSADAISGARPGARYDTVENYIERLEKLEEITNHIPGVHKSFAVQAGREIRVMVNPEEVDDLQAKTIAINAARQIEQGLEYPGQIKVNVIRETRVVEYAK